MHPFTSHPAAKRPKHSKLDITSKWEKPLHDTGIGFSSRNSFANLGSFAKVSIPVHIYNSLDNIKEL